MRALREQILYQCEYCDKRFITKQGARRHEEDYCYMSPIPQKRKTERIKNCKHHFIEVWDTMPGEPHLQQPDHMECADCGVWETEWKNMKEDVYDQDTTNHQ